MTKDYEADSIADETLARSPWVRRMQSPYTRAEFVAAELRKGFDGLRTELNAQAAERAGITWRVDNICPTCRCNQGWERCINGRMCLKCGDFVPDKKVYCQEFGCGELCQSFDLDGRGVCMRHGVVERPTVDAEPVPSLADQQLVDRIAALERRESLHIQAIGELSARLTTTETKIGQLDNSQLAGVDYEERLNEWRGRIAKRVTNLEKDLCGLSIATRRSDDDLAGRISALEQQVARPIVAEIRDPTGARTIYHAIEERAKDEIRTLIREEIGRLTDQIHQRVEEVIQPACETISDHDRRLSLQLERITELDNSLQSVSRMTEIIRRRLYESVTDDVDYGLLEQTGRLCRQLERITELANRKDEAFGRIVRLEIGKSSLGNRVDDLAEQVCRLDADMALVRDAVCPPQGASSYQGERAVLWHNDDERIMSDGAIEYTEPAAPERGWLRRQCPTKAELEFARRLMNSLAEPAPATTFKCAGKYCPGLPYPPSERIHPESCVVEPTVAWPDPTPTMLESPVFEAIWQAIKSWDIAVPGAYSGYCEACGNHVRAILDAIQSLIVEGTVLVPALGGLSKHLRQTRDALRAACLELGADAAWSDDTNLADVVWKVLMPHVHGMIIVERGRCARIAQNTRVIGRDSISVRDGIAKDIVERAYESHVADEEMEAIQRVLGDNYRDLLRPRAAE